MQWVELLRWQDFRNPGSVDRDPIFKGNALPKHDVSCAETRAQYRHAGGAGAPGQPRRYGSLPHMR